MEAWEIPATYEYPATCAAPGCDVQHGVVRFVTPQVNWDPKACGLMCGECYTKTLVVPAAADEAWPEADRPVKKGRRRI